VPGSFWKNIPSGGLRQPQALARRKEDDPMVSMQKMYSNFNLHVSYCGTTVQLNLAHPGMTAARAH